MIASLAGRVAAVSPDGVVVEVGGVGLFVSCTPTVIAGLPVGGSVRLATSLIVREDALTLYGFADEDERTVFELLQTATGVGPRLAQAVLAVHRPDAVRRAVATDDLAALSLVPGVGRKVAQRIVLELRDRLGPEVGTPLPADGQPAGQLDWRDQVRTGLVGLGWSVREAEEALAAVAPQAEEAARAGEPPQVADLLRSALRSGAR
jgi:holliday junction DNA helicase RuvA